MFFFNLLSQYFHLIIYLNIIACLFQLEEKFHRRPMMETDDNRYNFFYHLGNYMLNMINVDPDLREEQVRRFILGKISGDEKNFTRVSKNKCKFFKQ